MRRRPPGCPFTSYACVRDGGQICDRTPIRAYGPLGRLPARSSGDRPGPNLCRPGGGELQHKIENVCATRVPGPRSQWEVGIRPNRAEVYVNRSATAGNELSRLLE